MCGRGPGCLTCAPTRCCRVLTVARFRLRRAPRLSLFRSAGGGRAWAGRGRPHAASRQDARPRRKAKDAGRNASGLERQHAPIRTGENKSRMDGRRPRPFTQCINFISFFFLSENANRLEIHFLSSQARVTWRKGLPRFRWNFLPRLRHGGQLRSSCVSSGGRTCWAAPVEAPPGAPTPQGIEAGPPLDTQTNKHAVGLVCDRALLICVWVYALGIVTWQINDNPASLFEVQQFASSVFAFAATEQLRNDLANHRHGNLQDKNTNTLEWNHSP